RARETRQRDQRLGPPPGGSGDERLDEHAEHRGPGRDDDRRECAVRDRRGVEVAHLLLPVPKVNWFSLTVPLVPAIAHCAGVTTAGHLIAEFVGEYSGTGGIGSWLRTTELVLCTDGLMMSRIGFG